MGKKAKRYWRLGPVKDLGIDLGTANTIVYVKGKGVVLKEPSVVAISLNTNSILAVGSEAKDMLGRTPANIAAIRPLKEGAIADFETTRRMLKYFIEKTLGKNLWLKPRVIISVPFGTTQVEKRAVIEAAHQGGAKEVFLVEEPLAAAIGAGLPVEEPVGHMIVNIGGGTTEIAVISLGGIVRGVSVRSGGDALNRSIIDYLRKNFRMEIGERTAENIKIQIGYATSPKSEIKMEVRGINLRNSLPMALELTGEEITEAMQEPLTNMLTGIKKIYENTPAQLASDIIDTGITLTGGGALLKNIDKLIAQEMNLPVTIAEDPIDCVALGTGKIISQMKTLTRLALYHV
ncbi:MAG: rod shape-determining protein [Zhaonellaceae bacterium]|nr:rod shape-determining protein [Clostridia bacterium]